MELDLLIICEIYWQFIWFFGMNTSNANAYQIYKLNNDEMHLYGIRLALSWSTTYLRIEPYLQIEQQPAE